MINFISQNVNNTLINSANPKIKKRSNYPLKPSYRTYFQSVHHLYCSCPVRILPLVPMPSQYTICILSMSSQYTICTTHIQSDDHLYCPYTVRIPHLLPMYGQYTISTAHVQSVHYMYCPCPVSKPSLLPMSHQNITFPVHGQ